MILKLMEDILQFRINNTKTSIYFDTNKNTTTAAAATTVYVQYKQRQSVCWSMKIYTISLIA